MSEVRALTIRQPWASLIALGVKTIETRSWSTKYRGPLLVHAGLWDPHKNRQWSTGIWTDVSHEPVAGGFYPAIMGSSPVPVDPAMVVGESMGSTAVWTPLGAVVATATLTDCVPIVDPGASGNLHNVLANGSGITLLHWGGPYDGDYTDHTDQIPYGDFTPGRFAWMLSDVRAVDPVTEYPCGVCGGIAACAYHQGTCTCSFGCTTEPACFTSGPYDCCNGTGLVPVCGRPDLWTPDAELAAAITGGDDG